jgi:hypothetical protein
MKITRENTLIILDWDDTLFPTSWVMKNGMDLSNKAHTKKFSIYFSDLDKMLHNLLTRLKKCGRVVIVTNALPEWVKTSSRILINSAPLVKDTKVVSARKMYQNIIGNSMEWKKFAFKDELTEMTKRVNINNIISVGDAEYEYQALISLHKNDKKFGKLLKSVRLMKNPSYESLLDQLNVLHDVFPHICIKRMHADMNFTLH